MTNMILYWVPHKTSAPAGTGKNGKVSKTKLHFNLVSNLGQNTFM